MVLTVLNDMFNLEIRRGAIRVSCRLLTTANPTPDIKKSRKRAAL